MSRKWTENQHNAIYATNGSVLVSAAAGSGKTAVLVERIIKLITRENSPVDVDRLLVVTFTRAAASEMKERVTQALNKLLSADPFNKNLLIQKQKMFKSNISTIDSFCIDIAREYFYTLNIKQDFRIADDRELSVLKNDAMEYTLEHFYNENSKDFNLLVKSFSSPKNDNTIVEVIDRVYSFLLSHPFPDIWQSEKLLMYDDFSDVSETVWGKEIINYTKSAIDYCADACLSALSLISENYLLIGTNPHKLFTAYKSDLEKISELLCQVNWDNIALTLNEFKFGTLRFPKKFEDEELTNQIKILRENVKGTLSSVQKLFCWNNEECKADIDYLYPIVRKLFQCVNYYRNKIEEYKLQKNIADFSDIEHYIIKLFVKGYDKNKKPVLTDTAKEVSKRFDYIMVDECQDVNEVQDLIFRAISKDEKNLFMVGDVKQSIYGFRQAMPEIFLARKDAYKIYNEDEDNYPSKIILDKNFRSRKSVAHGINFIFSRLMSKEVGDMEYSDEEILNAAAEFPETDDFALNFALIDRDDFSDDIDFTVLEARYIALQIQEMVLSKYQIAENGSRRDIRYSDFAILLRSTTRTAETYVNELMSMGVPAYSETKGSFFEADEIKVMLNFLRVLDNPVLDIPLLSVMMSPIYGFTADEMAEIKCSGKFYNLYSAVLSYAEKNGGKSAGFLKEISNLRTFSVTNSVEDLLKEIYNITGYQSVVSAVEERPNAVKNLNLLCEYASQYELNGYKGLSAFIHYLDKIKECGSDFESGSLVNGEITNTVQVMSIHKSKGLEFPVCFLAATSRGFNKNDLKKDVLLHSDLGIGVKKRENLCRYTTMPREGVALEISKSQMSEELRVLYVALTRAKEKLYVINSQKNPIKYLEELSLKINLGGNISSYSVKNADSISDWMFMCMLAYTSFSGNLLNEVKRIMPAQKQCSKPENDKYPWNIMYINKEVCDLENFEGIISPEIFTNSDFLSSEPDNDFINILKERINFKYKYSPLVKLPTKVSASDIAHKDAERFFSKVLQRPNFMSKESLTATERGTAFHKFLQYCDFANAKENSEKEINRLKDLNYLSEAEARAISYDEVSKFMESSLAQKIIMSKEVLREFRFMTYINAEDFDNTVSQDFAEEKILLQGAVDLAFEENGHLVIVDYKTDRVKDIKQLKDIYSKQLSLYKTAMESCTDYKVKECIIFSLYLGDYISIN